MTDHLSLALPAESDMHRMNRMSAHLMYQYLIGLPFRLRPPTIVFFYIITTQTHSPPSITATESPRVTSDCV